MRYVIYIPHFEIPWFYFFDVIYLALIINYTCSEMVVKKISTSRRRGLYHDDVIKWKHFPRNWSFVRGIHWSPVNSPHKGQWRGALMFSLICVWINGWENNREAGDLRRYRAHYDVIVMYNFSLCWLRACLRDWVWSFMMSASEKWTTNYRPVWWEKL